MVQTDGFVARRSRFTELPYHKMITDLLYPGFEAPARIPRSIQPRKILVDDLDLPGTGRRGDGYTIAERIVLSCDGRRPQIGFKIETDLVLFE